MKLSGFFALVLPAMGLACLLLAPLTQARAEDTLPQVSAEGLQLQQGTGARVVYLRPGADFSRYRRVAILDTDVQFARNWQRDYNASSGGLQGRVTASDIDRMKAAIAAEFNKVFTAELEKGDGYQVVADAGPEVLVLKPALVDVQVTAPDIRAGNTGKTLARSAGQMTLYLELWDSGNTTILARIMDPQRHESTVGLGRLMDRGSNKAALDGILKQWAVKLRKHLDAARVQRPATP